MPSGEEGGRGCFRGEAVSHRRPRPLRRPRGNLARPRLRTARPSMEFAPLLRPVGGRHQGPAKVNRESVRRPSTDDVGGRNRFQTDRHGDTDDRPRRDVGGLVTVTAGTRRSPEAGTGDCHTAAAAAAATVRTRTGRPAWGEPGPRPGGGSRPGPRGPSPRREAVAAWAARRRRYWALLPARLRLPRVATASLGATSTWDLGRFVVAVLAARHLRVRAKPTSQVRPGPLRSRHAGPDGRLPAGRP